MNMDSIDGFFCYFASDAGIGTGNVRRADIKNKITANTKQLTQAVVPAAFKQLQKARGSQNTV
jgi:hypothetical protein